jgi:hypothetical protein
MCCPPHILIPPRHPKVDLLTIVDGIRDHHFMGRERDFDEKTPKGERPVMHMKKKVDRR